MAAETAKQNFVVEQGATWEQALLWSDDDGPVDLTGYTARMQVRKTLASSATEIELTTANGRIVLDEIEDPPGTVVSNIQLILTDELTAAFETRNTKQTWRYDLDLTSPGGATRKLLKGKFVVNPEVTR